MKIVSAEAKKSFSVQTWNQSCKVPKLQNNLKWGKPYKRDSRFQIPNSEDRKRFKACEMKPEISLY